MAQSNSSQSSAQQPEVLRPHEEIREAKTEAISLKTAADVMGTPEALLLSQENLEKNQEGMTLLKANLISLLNKLLRVDPSLDVKSLNLKSFPQKIRENQDKMALTKEEIIALSRLESAPSIQKALKNSWEQIQNEVTEGAEIAKETKEGKPLHEKIINAFKEDPVKAVAYTAIGIGAIYAGWRLFKWAFGEKKENESKIGTTGKLALGGIALAALGAFIGPKKIMEWLPSLSGLKAGFEKTKAIAAAIASGNFAKAYELWTSDEDPKEDLHNSYAKFIEEKTNQKIDSKVFRVFGAQSYSKFKTDVSSSQWTEVLKAGKDAVGDLIASGISMTAILGMSDKEVRIQATRVAEFLEKEVKSSPDFDGKTLDEVMTLIQENPEKYLKNQEEKKEKKEAKVTPETIGGAMEIAYNNTVEDFSALLGDLKEVVKDLKGADAVIAEYQAQVEELKKEDSILVEAKIQWAKVGLTRKLLSLMWKENWTLAMKGGVVVIWNGTKIITHRSFDALWEPAWYLLSRGPEEALNSYMANVGSIVIFAGSAGAISGALTKSGILEGFATGAAKGAIAPIYLGKKMIKDMPFYKGHLGEYTQIIIERMELAKKYALKTIEKPKLILKKGVAKDLKFLALQEEYSFSLRNLVEKELAFYKKAQRLDVSLIDAKNKHRVDSLAAKKANLNDILDNRYIYDTAGRNKFWDSLNKNPEAQKVFRASGNKLDKIAHYIEQYKDAKWSKFLLANPKALELLVNSEELHESLTRYGFLAAVEEPAVLSKIERLFASGISDEEIKKGLSEIATSHKHITAGKGETKVENALESDLKLKDIHQKSSQEILNLQKKGIEIQENIQKSMQANPKLSPDQFFASPEGLKLKQELDAVNAGLEKTTKEYTRAIALELSGGKFDDLDKLDKPLKKRALEFMVSAAGKEIPLANRLAATMISKVGNKMLILAPLIAIKAYAHGSREGLGAEIGSAAVSMTPVLGTLADFYSAATGKDYISGAEVGRLESLGWAITGAACDALVLVGGAGMGARLVLKGARTTEKVGRIAKAVEASAEAIKASKNLTRVTKAGTAGAMGMMVWTAGGAAYEWVTQPKEVAQMSLEGIEK